MTRKRLQRGFQSEGCAGSLKGDLTLAELAAKHRAYQTMIVVWRISPASRSAV